MVIYVQLIKQKILTNFLKDYTVHFTTVLKDLKLQFFIYRLKNFRQISLIISEQMLSLKDRCH